MVRLRSIVKPVVPRVGRHLVVGGVTAAMVAAVLAGFVERRPPEPCAEVQATSAWTPQTRARIEEVLAESGSPLARPTLERIVPKLDRARRRWQDVRAEVCESDGEDPAAVRCLSAIASHIQSWVELVGIGEPSVVEHLASSVEAFPDVRACANGERARRIVWEGPDWTRARVALDLGDRSAARVSMLTARKGSDVELPRGSLVAGRLAQLEGDALSAEEAFIEGYYAARERGETWLQREAAIELVELLCDDPSREAEIERWLEVARTVDSELDSSNARFDEVDLLRVSARAHVALGELAKAREELTLATALLEPSSLELAEASWELARVHARLGNHSASVLELERAVSLVEAVLSAAHPRSAALQYELGRELMAWERPQAATRALQRAVEGYEIARGPTDPATVLSIVSLARVLAARGVDAEARRWLARAQAAVPDAADHVRSRPGAPSAAALVGELNLAMGESLWHHGDEVGSLERFDAALEAFEPGGAEHYGATIRAATANLDAGRPAAARTLLEPCLGRTEKRVGPRSSSWALLTALLGRAYGDEGFNDAGRELCARAGSAADVLGDHEVAVVATSCLVDVYLSRRELVRASEVLEALEAKMTDEWRLNPQSRARWRFAAARIEVGRGDAASGRAKARGILAGLPPWARRVSIGRRIASWLDSAAPMGSAQSTRR